MGKKSSAKANTPPAAPPPERPRSKAPAIAAGLVLVALAVGVFTYMRDGSPADAQQNPAAADAQIPQRPPVPADLKAHPQADLPPLQFPGYPTARPPDVIRAAYKFAAEHPEVMSYVPCYCGCEHLGHRGNEDCFVKARDVNGDVVEWEDHGMECAVCLDVATKALQMYTSGASVVDIRAAVEKQWTPLATTHTPTPEPPRHE
jgi:hypothetical protein